MTDLQKRFADEYVIDSNISKAAERAGLQGDAKRVSGWQMMQLPEVQEYIEAKQKEIEEKAEISAIWVRRRFKDISDRCMQAEPVMIFDGSEWVESGEYKFDSGGANRATENLGKIIGVFEKDNLQNKSEIKIINMGSGIKPDEATS